MSPGKKRSVRESYNALGGVLYDVRYRKEQTSKHQKILQHVDPEVFDIVLDNGCGTGLLLEMLKGKLVGIDLSSSFLSTAYSRFKSKREAHLAQADAEHLPFRDEVFDKIFAITLIQNIPEPGIALEEIRRVSHALSEVTLTALKKTFSLKAFHQLIEVSGFHINKIIKDESLKDWIAFTTHD